jgi:hypothetical protein
MRRGMFRCEPVEGQCEYSFRFAKRVIVLTSEVHPGENNANVYTLNDKTYKHNDIRSLQMNLGSWLPRLDCVFGGVAEILPWVLDAGFRQGSGSDPVSDFVFASVAALVFFWTPAYYVLIRMTHSAQPC